jgi:hypothetical protein
MTNHNLLAVTGTLDDAGVPYSIVYGKHLRVQSIAAGQKRMVVAARSGSDWRADKNNRALVRRLLRQDGMLGHE